MTSTVRSFYNICPHRGNTLLYDPAGNAKRMTCIFHAWSFDTRGNCIDISRAEQGYQDRFCKEDAALREVKAADGLWRLRLGQSRRPEHVAPGLHRPGARHAGAADAGADGGVPLPQGGREHQLQAVARHQQRVLSRLLALLQSHHRHDAARLLRSQIHRLSERPCVGRFDGDQVRRVRGQQGKEGWMARTRTGWLDPDRHLSRHDLQPAHLGAAHGYGHSAWPQQGGHRIPRPRVEARHAGRTRGAHFRSQHDLGAVRPQPA